jgi:ubiquinone/menaquinone biosynthesis C-methylase UbiE
MDQQLELVTDLLLQTAAPRVGESVLDVGCGTGATLLRLAAAIGNEGHVLGCDVSAPMLALARQRIAAAGAQNADVIQADAQSHHFAESSFDLLVSRFGVMFFADPTAAFANLRRALRPAGGSPSCAGLRWPTIRYSSYRSRLRRAIWGRSSRHRREHRDRWRSAKPSM